MESFLSGYSKGYTGNVGMSYTGGVSGAGTAGGASSNGHNADVSQLKPGDTFQGEIASVNGEDVQIQLANGQYLAAKLERDVQVALGQILNLQVQSNKDNKVVLKPVIDGNAQMLRVGEAALKAASMSVNERNLQLVAKLIENGMPINKNTLMTYNRLALQNPKVTISNIIELNKLKLPITDDNARQLENYRNLEHKILDGVKDAANELVKAYESIANGTKQGNLSGSMPNLPALENGAKFMEKVLSLVADENLAESAETENSQSKTNADIKSENSINIAKNTDNAVREGLKSDIKAENEVNIAKNGNNANNATIESNTNTNSDTNNLKTENNLTAASHATTASHLPAKADGSAAMNADGLTHGENTAKAENSGKVLTATDNTVNAENSQKNVQKDGIAGDSKTDNRDILTEKTRNFSKSVTTSTEDNPLNDSVNTFKADIKSGQALNQAQKSPAAVDSKLMPQTLSKEEIKEIENQLKGETLKSVPDKIINYISGGKLDIKALNQLLTDTGIGKSLTPEQKSKIFDSEPFKSLLKSGLQKRWSLTPADIASEGKVEEFYNKLLKESNRLAKLINEAVHSAANAQAAGTTHAKAMGNIAENVEFINQMNQMFNYVQLPLKFGDSQAHGDLYVYTNKRNIARKDGMLTAFLHLDMDNLGPLDVSIVLQTEKMQITTKFYLDEDSIKLVGEHMDGLVARLEKKGYKCKSMVLEKNEDKTVLGHIEEQVAAGSAVIGYRTFDTRA